MLESAVRETRLLRLDGGKERQFLPLPAKENCDPYLIKFFEFVSILKDIQAIILWVG
jgi:hypothetical protein